MSDEERKAIARGLKRCKVRLIPASQLKRDGRAVNESVLSDFKGLRPS